MRYDLGDASIQDIYAALVNDQARNDMIADDLVRSVRIGTLALVAHRANRTPQLFRPEA
jgi:hypothetical protein